jgi:hypothetical protein
MCLRTVSDFLQFRFIDSNQRGYRLFISELYASNLLTTIKAERISQYFRLPKTFLKSNYGVKSATLSGEEILVILKGQQQL